MIREIQPKKPLTRIFAVQHALFILTLVLLDAEAVAAPRQVVQSRSVLLVSQLQPVTRLAPTQRLNLVIGLPLRNQAALDDLLSQLYDPTSPNFHRFLSPAQFAEQFGPSETDYNALSSFLQSNGLTVVSTHPNRTLLDVSGSVADIEKIFAVRLNTYSHPTEPRMFYAPDAPPSLDFQVSVLSIAGLDNYILPKPMHVTSAPPSRRTGSIPQVGSGPSGSYLGGDFRAAYVPGVTLNGAGQRVGLLQFDGYYPQDIAAYESYAGLPNVPLQNVLLNGFSGNPSTNTQAVLEVSLDIEMAISMAPGLAQVIVYEGIQPNDILNRMATDNLAAQLSASWTYATDSNTDNIYKQFAAQGQSFFNSSGDGDAYPGAPATPTDNPYITVVGGTILSTASPGGAWTNEVVWSQYDATNGSSGGISTTYALPNWQQGVDMSANGGSTANRNLPDVAMVASGVCVIANNNVTNSTVGGTSVATPLWAGFTALVNQQAAALGRTNVGFLNPIIYALGRGNDYPFVFHDITVGNNTNRLSTGNFFARAGYDLCTGWGSPAGLNLINELASFAGAVWVDFNNNNPGDGSYNNPYWTLARGIGPVKTNGTIAIKGPASSIEVADIRKAMTLRAAGGVVTIGH